MTTLTITGLVTDTGGASSPINGVISVLSPPVVDSVIVSPPSGPLGTLFTITVNAHEVNVPPQLPLTYTVFVNGAPATPTAQANIFTYQS